MNQQNSKINWSFYLILGGALITSLFIIREFAITIISALIFANVFYPLFKSLRAKFKLPDFVIGAITFIITLLLFIIPTGLIIFFATGQVIELIGDLDQYTEALENINLNLENDYFEITTDQLNDLAQNLANNAASFVFGNITNFGSLPILWFTHILIFIFVYFSGLIKGEAFVSYLKSITPLEQDVKNQVFNQVDKATKSTFLSIFTGSFAQTLSVLVILLILDVEYAFLWSIITFFAAILPIGSGLVIIPMGILFLFTGRPVEGIILLVYEAVVVASIDNIVRAVTGSKDTKLNSTLSLISLAGGVLVFGIIGIILGPISFVVTKELLDIYKNNKY